MQRWEHAHGTAPTIRDWQPNLGRQHGVPELAERFEREACWPTVRIVQRRFGSWGAALDAAGVVRRDRVWDEASALRAIRSWVNKHARPPAAAE